MSTACGLRNRQSAKLQCRLRLWRGRILSMQHYDAEHVRDSALSWALWKALDFLTERYLTPYASSLAAGGAKPSAGAIVEPEALVAASQQLSDPASPVLKALTAIWAQRGSADESGLAALNEQLSQLAPAEGLVVLSVIAQALKANSAARN